MDNNERGGILSKLLTVPVGVALLVAFFFLGFYLGKHQGRGGESEVRLESLPDMANQYLPKKEDLTFYKTLTEHPEKSVSVALPPAQSDTPPAPPAAQSGRKKTEEKKTEITIEREPLEPAKAPSVKQKPPAPKKGPSGSDAQTSKVRFTVQIASYPDRELAEDEVRRMKQLGYAAFVVSSDVPERGTWHRVRLGSFQNKASADKLARELQAKAGVSPLVTAE